MSIKFGLQSLALCGFMGFIVGLFGYPKAIAARNVALESGDHTKDLFIRLLTDLSKILFWGGLVLTIISVALYLLYRKWERNHHDT